VDHIPMSNAVHPEYSPITPFVFTAERIIVHGLSLTPAVPVVPAISEYKRLFFRRHNVIIRSENWRQLHQLPTGLSSDRVSLSAVRDLQNRICILSSQSLPRLSTKCDHAMLAKPSDRNHGPSLVCHHCIQRAEGFRILVVNLFVEGHCDDPGEADFGQLCL